MSEDWAITSPRALQLICFERHLDIQDTTLECFVQNNQSFTMPGHRYEAFKLSLGTSNSAHNMESLESLPLAYASCSLGCKPEHNLIRKIEAIASAGFTGIEISMPDLVALANDESFTSTLWKDSPPKCEISSKDFEALKTVAAFVYQHLQKRGLEAMLMQPFANFEGWPQGSAERKDAWERVEGWTTIMGTLDCKTLQVGSTDTPAEKITADRGSIVEDLRQLADRLAEKGMRVAYENWCWSTHAPDWQDVWDICRKVDRPNFGLCLDTFQSAGGEWGDPTTASGLVEDGRSSQQVEDDWKASCEKLSSRIPADKIYLLQISDAYKPREPFAPEPDADGMRARARWSSAWRPLPFEGYLPAVDFAAAVLQTGFRGWFSYELFDGGPDGKGKAHDLDEWVDAAKRCQDRLVKECAKAR